MKRVVYFILGLVGVLSCTDKGTTILNNCEEEGVISLSISKNKDYQPHIINEAIMGNYGNYLKYFEGTDYEIGISSSKDGLLPRGTSISCISGPSQIKKSSLTRSAEGELPVIRSFVDGLELSRNNLLPTRSSNGITDCFGKTVTFSFKSENAPTRSSEGDSGEVDMYVPKAIELLFPYAETKEDLFPLCYYKDFIIRWNEDEKNENGVLVMIDWNGSMILGDDISGAHVCRIAVFPDNGEARLTERLFEGIPDTAKCELLLMRGNVDNIEQENYSYKLVGETHQLFSFILIREIEEV